MINSLFLILDSHTYLQLPSNELKPECNHHSPIDSEPNRTPLGLKSIGKLKFQHEFDGHSSIISIFSTDANEKKSTFDIDQEST